MKVIIQILGWVKSLKGIDSDDDERLGWVDAEIWIDHDDGSLNLSLKRAERYQNRFMEIKIQDTDQLFNILKEARSDS